jgi:hypothetical protein
MSTIPKSAAGGAETLEQHFERLADRWHAAKSVFSSPRPPTWHPMFLEIAGMGEAVIPFLLRRIEKGEMDWDLMLGAITGLTPSPPETRDEKAINDAWLDWARKNGYDW